EQRYHLPRRIDCQTVGRYVRLCVTPLGRNRQAEPDLRELSTAYFTPTECGVTLRVATNENCAANGN
ncbi:MAG TPA: hypothetical protein VHE81_12990, partial [Lacipirellulaceae bacterium]|nr:hypothetical protein [Lacipirellulaceae bacterium]